MLACVALTDEFWSGVAVVAAPDVEREHDLEHGGYALLVFALPLLGGAVLEAGLSLFADRYPRRLAVRFGSFAAAAALVLCAVAPVGALLAVGLMLAGTASGVACSAAKGELVLGSAVSAARAMTRWVLLGAVGDVLTPVLVAAILSAGQSYRTAFLAAAGLAFLQGLWIAPRERRAPARAANGSPPPDAPPSTRETIEATETTETTAADGQVEAESAEEGAERAEPEEEASVPLLAALRQGVRERRLWLWLVGAALCTFLDELVIALGALYAERDLGASAAMAVACVAGASAGSVLGAWITERLLGTMAPDRVLVGSAAATLLALVAVVAAPTLSGLALALFALGVVVAPQYALLEAKAYAASPGRPGVVTALAQVFVVVDIGGPLLLGLLADGFGVRVALACLAVQPLGILLVMLQAARRDARSPSPSAARDGAGE